MLRELPRLARAHARLDVAPGGVERPLAAVVDLVGIAVEGEVGRGVRELELRERRCARLAAEGVERRVQVRVRSPELLAEGSPSRAVGLRIAREHRSEPRVGQLQRVARDDPHPAASARRERREGDDVVLDDDVGLKLVDDLHEAAMDVARAVAESLVGGCDELAELLDRGLAEDRRRVVDEVDPELPWDLVLLGPRAEPHQPLLEAARLECPGERLLEDEDDAMPALAQDRADAGAVVGRPVRALGKEDDAGHQAWRLAAIVMPSTIVTSTAVSRHARNAAQLPNATDAPIATGMPANPRGASTSRRSGTHFGPASQAAIALACTRSPIPAPTPPIRPLVKMPTTASTTAMQASTMPPLIALASRRASSRN